MSAVYGYRRLTTTFVCHYLDAMFVYRNCSLTFICMRTIQMSKIYPIDNKKNQINGC